MPQSERPRVVIVGAGFGGLWAARALGGKPVDVLVLDRNNFHVFWPLLYQIAAAEIDATEVAYPVRSVLRKEGNVRFQMAEVIGVDRERKVVRTRERQIPYDRLILALGSTPHFLGIPGAEENAFPLKSLDDALELRNQILSRFEVAAVEPDVERRRRLLRFVIVGGGTTGVEFAGALMELIRSLLRRDYQELDGRDPSVILVEALDSCLAEFPAPLGAYAKERLERMGVEVRLSTKVAELAPGRVNIEGAEPIESDTVVWSAGVRGHPLIESFGLSTTPKGTVRVEADLRVRGAPDLFAVGDIAMLEQDGAPLPMVAPVATQQAEIAAENVLRSLREEPLVPFRYRDPGRLATIGRNKAVAHVRGRSFTGFPAWALWAGVHLGKLIGARNKLLVLINWLDDYLFYQRAIRLVLPFHKVEDVVSEDADVLPPEAIARAEQEQRKPH
jgi:NADH:ubiquinone reductase (H+-translocating)